MSYAANDQLPDDVKEVLPDAAQTIWREAFNAAAGQDEDETAAIRTAYAAVGDSGFEKGEDGTWAKKDEKKTHEFDAEVFSVGTWNGDKYTEKDLDDMVASFAALRDEVKPPVKLGHESSRFGQPGKVALGWVKALKRKGQKLVATLTQVPDVVYKAIKNGLYKRVSSEVHWDLKKGGRTHNRVLAAVALLGADLPAVTNLADLEAYLTQSTAPGAGSFGRVAAYSFDVDDNGAIQKEQEMDQKAYEEKLAAEKAAREAAEAEAKKYKEQYEAHQAALAKKVKEDRAAEIRSYCETQVKAGRMTPAARDILCADLAKHTYSEDGGFAVTFDTLMAVFEKQGKLLPEGENGHDGGKPGDGKQYSSAGAEVDAKARAYAKDNQVGYSAAVVAVLGDDDDLAARYASETITDKEAD